MQIDTNDVNKTGEQLSADEQAAADAIKVADDASQGIETKPEEQEQQGDRPEWLPEKFKSPEDMAKAYSELESKLGSKQEEKPDEQKPDEQKPDDKTDFDKYTKEFVDSGKLSDETYKELAELGYSKSVVDAQLDGIKAQMDKASSVTQETIDSVYSHAGGEEQFKQVASWAVDNADSALVEAYDKATESGDQVVIKALYDQINKAYTDANGVEGKRLTGGSNKTSGESFENWAQVEKAMSDKRYMGHTMDSSYVAEVNSKLARSNF